MKRILPLLLISVCICSCSVQNEKTNRFSDKNLQKIFTFQYNRQSDSLYPYFKDQNPLYRKEAALSFSSVGDTVAIEKLYPLLKDPDIQVRESAAFSIGQYKNSRAADTLIKYSKAEKNSEVNQYMLEAIGRCANNAGLQYLVDFAPEDSIEKAGVAWGIYRACRRNMISEGGTLKMSEYLSDDEAFEVVLAASFYFVHSKVNIDPFLEKIIKLAGESKHVEVKMAAVRALRNSQKTECADYLIKTLQNANDYRLRVDAINTLRFFPYDYCREAVWYALKNDENVSVKVSAAEFFENAKNEADYNNYLEQACATSNWRIRALLLSAAMKTGVNDKEVSELLKKYYSSTKEYLEKQMLISSLAEDVDNIEFISSAFSKESYGEMLYTYSEALLKIKSNPRFNEQDESGIASFIVSLLDESNKYLIIQGLVGIMNPDFNVKKYFPDPSYLTAAKEKCSGRFAKNDISYDLFDLAVDYYAKPEISENIDVLNDKISRLTGYSSSSYKPIDWNSICKIPSGAKVKMKTVKGDFVIQLLADEVPFTVNAFLDGVKNGLFDSLQFYRVVPDFVNQTGGTMDVRKESLANLNIRSEYNIRRHREGTVNMASAGRDTETSHFSIMLCPTPWNDNSYTIFGIVVEGMDVVHKLELGDYIISATEMK